MDGKRSNHIRIFSAFFIVVSLSGCAGSKGGIDILKPLDNGVHLNEYDGLEIRAIKNRTLITSEEKYRIVNLIKQKIKEKDTNRFNLVYESDASPRRIRATIKFKRYEKGSAADRLMLAGLGQIHIEADFLIEEMESNSMLAKYYVTKTFAWGGLYGGLTRIEDVEDGFADAIVSILFEEE